MVKWGLNGRPINEDSNKNIYYRTNSRKRTPKNNRASKPKSKLESHIQIINNEELIDKNMEINVLARLLDNNNRPISNVEINIMDNNKHIRTVKTSLEGYFIFYGGYIGRFHSFIFSFKGNDKYKSCNKSLIIA